MADSNRPAVTSDTGPWTPCPRWAFDRLSPPALRVYLALNFRVDHDGDTAFPSHKTLAVELGCSIPTVKRAVKECADAGAIQVTPRKSDAGDWTSNLYVVFRSDPKLMTLRRVMGEPTPRSDDPTGGVTSDPLTRTNFEPDPDDPENEICSKCEGSGALPDGSVCECWLEENAA